MLNTKMWIMRVNANMKTLSIVALCLGLIIPVFGQEDSTDTAAFAVETFVPLEDDPFISCMDDLLTMEIFELAKKNYAHGLSGVLKTEVEIPKHTEELVKNRLAYLDARTPLSLTYNEMVLRYIEVYVYNRREQMSRMLGLSKLYFPLFEEVLDQYDLPLELKYLAVVESALNPLAKSRVGATGLWQFMYATGKIYNLNVSSYVDERSDPLKSTHAACQYFVKLYQIFGDWNLVLAAYNSGPGNVNKAIRRAGGNRDYWQIMSFLPKETRGYVPAFIAANYAIHYSEEYAIGVTPVKYEFFDLDTVHVSKMMSFGQMAQLVGMDESDISFLNPSFKMNIVPEIEGSRFVLFFPRNKAGVFVHNQDSIHKYAAIQFASMAKPIPEYVTVSDRIVYKVRSGDYLGTIAKKHGCTVSDIMKWNNLKSTNIRAGQSLVIHVKATKMVVASSQPVNAEKEADEKPETTEKETEASANEEASIPVKENYYVVQQGDTLWGIARQFDGVTVDAIKEWNNITDTRSIRPGTKLIIKSI